MMYICVVGVDVMYICVVGVDVMYSFRWVLM